MYLFQLYNKKDNKLKAVAEILSLSEQRFEMFEKTDFSIYILSFLQNLYIIPTKMNGNLFRVFAFDAVLFARCKLCKLYIRNICRNLNQN